MFHSLCTFKMLEMMIYVKEALPYLQKSFFVFDA